MVREPGLFPTTNLELKLSAWEVRPGDPLVLTIEGPDVESLTRGKLITIEAEHDPDWEYVGAVIVQTALGPGGWRPPGSRIAMTMEGYFATTPMHFEVPPIPPGNYRIRVDAIARTNEDDDLRQRTATLYAQLRVLPSLED